MELSLAGNGETATLLLRQLILHDTSRKGTELLMRTHASYMQDFKSKRSQTIKAAWKDLVFLPIFRHSQTNIFQELSKGTAIFYLSSVICHNKEAVLIPVVQDRFSGAHGWAESFKISNENALLKPQVDDKPGFRNKWDILLVNSFLSEENDSVRVTSTGFPRCSVTPVPGTAFGTFSNVVARKQNTSFNIQTNTLSK